MLHWGGDPGGIDSLCKDLAECPRPYLLLLLSHLWLGFGSLYLGDLVKKRNDFLFFPMHCGSFFLFSIVEAEKDPLFPFHLVFLTYVFCVCLFRNPSNWGLLHPGPPSERATVWRSPTRCATGQLSTRWGVGCFRCLARSTHIDTTGFEKAKFEECLLSLWRR